MILYHDTKEEAIASVKMLCDGLIKIINDGDYTDGSIFVFHNKKPEGIMSMDSTTSIVRTNHEFGISYERHDIKENYLIDLYMKGY